MSRKRCRRSGGERGLRFMVSAPKVRSSIALAAALSGVISFFAPTLLAEDRRLHASDCYQSAQESNYNIVAIAWLCAVPDDYRMAKANIVDVHVYADDIWSNSSVTAQTCITLWAGGSHDGVVGGACGPTIATGVAFVGATYLQPARPYWTAAFANDFGYIVSTHAKEDFTGNWGFRGFLVRN
jgi:hypothetical protein